MGKGIKIGIAGAGVLAACFVGDKFVKMANKTDMPKYTVNDVCKICTCLPTRWLQLAMRLKIRC